ncbi:MAG: hypothetical protein Q8N09_12695 [Thermodesulfovibrionia bacterium]|nr:hypothetical protein [Thermodesulfovibrionia bacterium]
MIYLAIIMLLYHQPEITAEDFAEIVGIVTSRDNFVIDSDRNALKRRVMPRCRAFSTGRRLEVF